MNFSVVIESIIKLVEFSLVFDFLYLADRRQFFNDLISNQKHIY